MVKRGGSADSRRRWLVFLAAACVWLTGCPLPSDGSPQDANLLYRRAMNLWTTDPEGAADLFEKALQSDPAIAEAHKYLGVLYSQPERKDTYNPIRALYHLHEYLALKPATARQETIRSLMRECKRAICGDLIRETDPAGLASQLNNAKDQLIRLRKENARLEKEVERLRSELKARSATRVGGPSPAVRGSPSPASRPNPSLRTTQGGYRIHVVKRGEWVSRIARRYGVSIQDIVRANPGLDPNRVREGQELRIPVR